MNEILPEQPHTPREDDPEYLAGFRSDVDALMVANLGSADVLNALWAMTDERILDSRERREQIAILFSKKDQ
jgi:hypothetical protein